MTWASDFPILPPPCESASPIYVISSAKFALSLQGQCMTEQESTKEQTLALQQQKAVAQVSQQVVGLALNRVRDKLATPAEGVSVAKSRTILRCPFLH